MSLYLGLDSSTQSLSAILIDIQTRQLVLDYSISFNERLAEFGCKNGVLPSEDPTVAHSDPLMWLAAFDMLLDDLRKKGVDLSQVAAIAGSGQQHGSVYLNAKATAILKSLNPKKPLAQQLKPAPDEAFRPAARLLPEQQRPDGRPVPSLRARRPAGVESAFRPAEGQSRSGRILSSVRPSGGSSARRRNHLWTQRRPCHNSINAFKFGRDCNGAPDRRQATLRSGSDTVCLRNPGSKRKYD